MRPIFDRLPADLRAALEPVRAWAVARLRGQSLALAFGTFLPIFERVLRFGAEVDELRELLVELSVGPADLSTATVRKTLSRARAAQRVSIETRPTRARRSEPAVQTPIVSVEPRSSETASPDSSRPRRGGLNGADADTEFARSLSAGRRLKDVT